MRSSLSLSLGPAQGQVVAQGGDPAAFDDRSRLPTARLQHPLLADAEGYVADVDALTVAHASALLGAARDRKGEPIDLAVGVVMSARVGDRVSRGEPLAVLHANDDARLAEAERVLRSAITLSQEAVGPRELILERLLEGSAQPLA